MMFPLLRLQYACLPYYPGLARSTEVVQEAFSPASVVTYRCLLLIGFSGMVMASQPASISGFIYLILNLVPTGPASRPS